jgi:hypothetical protein
MVTGASCAEQDVDVPRMDEVEHAVGEDDFAHAAVSPASRG